MSGDMEETFLRGHLLLQYGNKQRRLFRNQQHPAASALTMRLRVWSMVVMVVVLLQCFLLSNVVVVEAALSSSELQAMQQLQKDLHVQQNAWPGSEDPCIGWQGVQCINNSVTGIQLSGLPREANQSFSGFGFGLNAVQYLPNLRELNASGFALSGFIPNSFVNLRALETLDFSGCSLTGAIPSALGNLSSLRVLSLATNNLTGAIPGSVGNIFNLTILNLSYNNLTGAIPPYLFNALTLTDIDLSHNYLSGQIPPSVGNLTNLQTFLAPWNKLVGALPLQLGKLSFLTQLDLSANLLSGPIPGDLGNLQNLNFLNLASNNLSGSIPQEITRCAGLHSLIWRENRISGTIPDRIGDLRNLVSLDLSSNLLTGVLPQGLTTFVLLQRLDLAHNYFYGPILSQFNTLQNIQSLNVSFNFFNATLPFGLLPDAVVKKNCLTDAPNQHTTRSCTRFYARKGLVYGATTPVMAPGPVNLQPPLPTETPQNAGGNKSVKHLVPIVAGVGGGLGLIIIVAALVFCVHRFQRNRGTGRANSIGSGGRGGSARVTPPPALPTSRMGEVFTYAQLQQATKNFSVTNLIANGHSGDLYRGLLDTGAMVAVKRIDLNKVRMDSYLQELEVLGRASHTRLVLLLGHCLDRDDEKFLVYKYTPNGDLASALHKKGSPGPCEDVLQSLDWITRLKIAIGVAEALAYLHSECSPPIIHRDVKASSILLDDKFEVRLGSLSDARVQDGDPHPSRITRLLGLSQSSDQGDPGAAVSTSSDVYSFGKVLLELVSGKLGISGVADPRTETWLEWALPLISVHDKESLPKLVDPSLIVDEDLLEEVWAMAIIARACLHSKPSKRPSMRHVLKALENPHKVVREENFGESLAMRTSSHSSWNEALFGSWRHNHNNNNSSSGLREDVYHGSLPVAGKPAGGLASTSGGRWDGNGGAPQGHVRRGSSDIVPEPIDEEPAQDAQQQ